MSDKDKARFLIYYSGCGGGGTLSFTISSENSLYSPDLFHWWLFLSWGKNLSQHIPADATVKTNNCYNHHLLPPPPPICGHGLDHSAGGNIAPILSPACNRRLKARWWVSVANSVTVQPVKGDILLQSWVWWFVALAGLKIFAICYIIPDKKCVLCSVGYILLAVEV